MAYRVATKCIHLEQQGVTCDRSGAVSFPIYQSATFAHPGLGESTGYDYSRLQNPTRQQVEEVVAGLESGVDGIAFSSGMAAVSAVMELFSPGDRVIIDEDLYGGSVRLFSAISEKNGLEILRINLAKESPEAYITEQTKAIFFETPTNPMMNVVDIAKVTAIAKSHGLLTIVDNTFLSPYLQNPLALGADLVIHSGTKYLGGHNDTLAGFVVAGTAKLAERLRYISKTIGAVLAPMDSWLILRGIKTLALRMEKIYPGLPGHPGHGIMKKQARGFGAMLTFEVNDKKLVEKLLQRLKLILFAESLGGVETLITYPITQTHADVPAERLAENGINDRVLRLSVGIEDISDLLADLNQALS